MTTDREGYIKIKFKGLEFEGIVSFRCIWQADHFWIILRHWNRQPTRIATRIYSIYKWTMTGAWTIDSHTMNGKDHQQMWPSQFYPCVERIPWLRRPRLLRVSLQRGKGPSLVRELSDGSGHWSRNHGPPSLRPLTAWASTPLNPPSQSNSRGEHQDTRNPVSCQECTSQLPWRSCAAIL